MKRFKAYDTQQSYLLPPSPREWLPADHLAYQLAGLILSPNLAGEKLPRR